MTGKFKTPMSSSNFNKLEAEAEKLRNENKWLKLHDFASGIGIKDQKTGILFLKKLILKKIYIFF